MLQKIVSSNVGTLGFVLLVLVRIYSGWGYAGARLKSKVIEYEETGWYDGNFEPKSEVELKRDTFLYQSEVKPAVDRIKLVSLSAAALWVGSCIALNTSYSMKPIFNEYDPKVLQKVQMDDDFAATAARASGGRPTYCDNRYYRAIANGGQGKQYNHSPDYQFSYNISSLFFPSSRVQLSGRHFGCRHFIIRYHKGFVQHRFTNRYEYDIDFTVHLLLD